jgi:hypothetical protein
MQSIPSILVTQWQCIQANTRLWTISFKLYNLVFAFLSLSFAARIAILSHVLSAHLAFIKKSMMILNLQLIASAVSILMIAWLQILFRTQKRKHKQLIATIEVNGQVAVNQKSSTCANGLAIF